jgi:hypothetical protein
MKKIVALAVTTASLAACATRSDNISASYISPVTYQGYSCRELSQEAARVSGRAAQAVGAHDQKATNDAVATGVGVVLFWPALFFIKGDGASAAEVASLRGQMEAIEQASIQKKCGIEFRRA